jgi:peptidoglycan/xylan/chitin deacetylase (PgdA/CDA1 family)
MKKEISREFMLSFDDGPLPVRTEKVVKVLKKFYVDKEPVRAGFFMIGDAPDNPRLGKRYYAPYDTYLDKGSVKKYPEIARMVAKSGHLIGNHTQHHAWFRWPLLSNIKSIKQEISGAENEIANALAPIGKTPLKIFRPPYMSKSRKARKVAENLGYQIILGELAWRWKIPSLNNIKKNLSNKLKNWKKSEPCVFCFHDIQWETYHYLEDIIIHLQNHGFVLTHFDPSRLKK